MAIKKIYVKYTKAPPYLMAFPFPIYRSDCGKWKFILFLLRWIFRTEFGKKGINFQWNWRENISKFIYFNLTCYPSSWKSIIQLRANSEWKKENQDGGRCLWKIDFFTEIIFNRLFLAFFQNDFLIKIWKKWN